MKKYFSEKFKLILGYICIILFNAIMVFPSIFIELNASLNLNDLAVIFVISILVAFIMLFAIVTLFGAPIVFIFWGCSPYFYTKIFYKSNMIPENIEISLIVVGIVIFVLAMYAYCKGLKSFDGS